MLRTAALSGRLEVYWKLPWLPFPRSHTCKIVVLALLGTHVPLLTILSYFLVSIDLSSAAEMRIVTVALAATLLGMGVTLAALRALLISASLTSRSLHQLLDEGRMPDLPAHFDDWDGRVMADVRYSIGHLDRLICSLEKLSATDYLTGVYNRRAAERRLGEDIARAGRGGETLWLAAVDVDNFKRINDEHGHDAGDLCLKHLVGIVNSGIRQGDWLARWGGDEFVLVLWQAAEVSPAGVLERIRSELKAKPVSAARGAEIVLTVSMGATRYNDGDDARALFARADDALYEAKRQGKDRVEYVTPIPGASPLGAGRWRVGWTRTPQV